METEPDEIFSYLSNHIQGLACYTWHVPIPYTHTIYDNLTYTWAGLLYLKHTHTIYTHTIYVSLTEKVHNTKMEDQNCPIVVSWLGLINGNLVR
jgi:hypothetical protein